MFFTTMEANARKWNDFYKIPVTKNDPRGNGDARDAFRHAFTAAEIKRTLLASGVMNNSEATAQSFHLGTLVEMANSNNYAQEFGTNPVIQSSNDLNMDLWNNAKGSMIISSSEADSAAKVKALLDKGELITTNQTASSKSISQLAHPFSAPELNWNPTYESDPFVVATYFIKRIVTQNIPVALDLLNQLWDSVADFFASAAGVVDSDISEGIDGMWIHASPIALDINKSGAIETISLANSKTYFDIDNDNFTEKLQWISPTDGWLAVSKINYS